MISILLQEHLHTVGGHIPYMAMGIMPDIVNAIYAIARAVSLVFS